MLLYLIRHADAVSSEENTRRPLSMRGQAQCTQLAQFLRANRSFTPNYLLHSPLLRSIETAQNLQRALCPDATLIETPGLEPEDSPRTTADQLIQRSDPSTLALVGHNFHLSLLATHLLRGNPFAETLDMPKASILALSSHGDNPAQKAPGTWRLLWFINPELLPAH